MVSFATKRRVRTQGCEPLGSRISQMVSPEREPDALLKGESGHITMGSRRVGKENKWGEMGASLLLTK